MASHSSILAWRTPWTGESGGLESIGSQRAGCDWSDLARMHEGFNIWILRGRKHSVHDTCSERKSSQSFRTMILFISKDTTSQGSLLLLELRSSVETFTVLVIEVSSKTFSLLLRIDYLSYMYIPTPISSIHQHILRYPLLPLYTHTHTDLHTQLWT